MACSGRALALGATHCTQHSHAGGRGGERMQRRGAGPCPARGFTAPHCGIAPPWARAMQAQGRAAAELRMALDAVTKDKKVKRGVKEVVKAIRKKQKGCAAATIVAVLV